MEFFMAAEFLISQSRGAACGPTLGELFSLHCVITVILEDQLS